MPGRGLIPPLALTLAMLLAPSAVQGADRFSTIDYPGANLTVAMGINANGDVVGYYRDAATQVHGFLLDRRGYASFDYPSASRTDAWAINEAGDIVGSYNDATGTQHGYVLRHGRFTPVDVPGATFTAGFGINSEGDVVGHFGMPPDGRMNGFVLRDGVFTTYDHPEPNLMTCGMGITPEGVIVGHYQDVSGRIHGFVLEEDEFTPLDISGSSNVQAYGITADHEVVGFFTSAGLAHGFAWDRHGAVAQVDVPGAVSTWVRRNNARGDMVGNYTDAAGVSHGFLMRR